MESVTKGVRLNQEFFNLIELQLKDYDLSFTDYVKGLIENDLFYNDLDSRSFARITIKEIRTQEVKLCMDSEILIKYIGDMNRQSQKIKNTNRKPIETLDNQIDI